MSLRAPTGCLLAFLAGAASADVAITGVAEALEENVAHYIVDEPPCDAAPQVVRQFADEIPQTIRPALEAFGYYEPTVSADIAARSSACWQVVVDIVPGPPVRVSEVSLDIRGDARDDAVIAAELNRFPLPPGSVLDHGRYALFKDRLEALARERGYLDALYVEERVEVFLDRDEAEIGLILASGPRYEFGPVTFMTDVLSENILERFVTFSPGDVYDASMLAELQRELGASGYFASATVLPDFDDVEGRQVPIRVDVRAAEPVSYSVGAGFSTDDGPRFRFSFENARRNRAAHQMGVDLLLAQVRQNVTFDYRIPLTHPLRDWLSLRAGVAREDVDAGVGAAVRIGVRRTRVADALTTTRYLDLLGERDDIAGREFTTRLLIPGVSWARSVRDDLVRPREGHRLSLGLALGVGDITLIELDLRGKWIAATPWDARVIVRGRIGAILEDDEFDRVPLSMRFFAGGDNSVRGFDYQSLGPRDANGELIGGNRLVEASVEYEHPVLESWGVAAFVDSGNAFLGSGLDAQTSVGVGGRWFSPIGPVRFDVAWPVEARAGGSRSPELHISLGPDL